MLYSYNWFFRPYERKIMINAAPIPASTQKPPRKDKNVEPDRFIKPWEKDRTKRCGRHHQKI